MKKIINIVFITLVTAAVSYAQFGQNKVNYKDSDWFYIQTKHFDIYFAVGGEKIAEFTA